MALDSKIIKTVVFDLDDTLFDTNGQLVKSAAHEACRAMVAAGLNANLSDVLKVCDKYLDERNRVDLFSRLIQKFGAKEGVNSKDILKAAFEKFHNRDVKEDIALFPQTVNVLQTLKTRFDLYLVTLGGPKTQRKKVDLLDLEKFFKKIFYVDVNVEKTKAGAFREILKLHPTQDPKTFLSVGNRIDSEIKDSKNLGMQTALLVHGEYVNLKPQSRLEEPDAKINSIGDLLGLL